jgi:hypothetical protein
LAMAAVLLVNKISTIIDSLCLFVKEIHFFRT